MNEKENSRIGANFGGGGGTGSVGGIGYGQTSACGKFTLGEMECMGSCVNAPMVAVADYTNGVEGFSYNYYEDLTAEDAVAVVDALVSVAIWAGFG